MGFLQKETKLEKIKNKIFENKDNKHDDQTEMILLGESLKKSFNFSDKKELEKYTLNKFKDLKMQPAFLRL